ncbi:hypothetical protein [Alysiella filiformis]|nr:hypothetical protein [Alysiella filiformis]
MSSKQVKWRNFITQSTRKKKHAHYRQNDALFQEYLHEIAFQAA